MERATPPTPGSPAAERLDDLGCFTRAVDDLLRERRRLALAKASPRRRRRCACSPRSRSFEEYKVDAKRDRLVRAAALIVSTLDTQAQA
jgi:hypothetical protein